jgi:hypothetical protein
MYLSSCLSGSKRGRLQFIRSLIHDQSLIIQGEISTIHKYLEGSLKVACIGIILVFKVGEAIMKQACSSNLKHPYARAVDLASRRSTGTSDPRDDEDSVGESLIPKWLA